MLAISKAFQIISSVYILNYIGGPVLLVSGECIDDQNQYLEECREQTSFILTNQQSLKIDLYYDSGIVTPDWDFVDSMCKARQYFNFVTFSYHVGVSVQRGYDGVLQCPNEDMRIPDCYYAISEACASELLTDFMEFLCCVHTYPIPFYRAAGQECVFAQQPDKLAEYQSCIHLQHPYINPEEILLQNSQDAQAKFPNAQCPHPFLTFNEKTDEGCTRNAFQYDPVRVICAMLADCN